MIVGLVLRIYNFGRVGIRTDRNTCASSCQGSTVNLIPLRGAGGVMHPKIYIRSHCNGSIILRKIIPESLSTVTIHVFCFFNMKQHIIEKAIPAVR